jgi:hypothetical protein
VRRARTGNGIGTGSYTIPKATLSGIRSRMLEGSMHLMQLASDLGSAALITLMLEENLIVDAAPSLPTHSDS